MESALNTARDWREHAFFAVSDVTSSTRSSARSCCKAVVSIDTTIVNVPRRVRDTLVRAITIPKSISGSRCSNRTCSTTWMQLMTGVLRTTASFTWISPGFEPKKCTVLFGREHVEQTVWTLSDVSYSLLQFH